MEGQRIRYLDPSFRSIASLIWKAYLIGQQLPPRHQKESSPGINVDTYEQSESYVKPIYHLEYSDNRQKQPREVNTLLLNKLGGSTALVVPATTPSQGIVWFHYNNL